jgi:myo-inositol-1(or 4)-monophosphatase
MARCVVSLWHDPGLWPDARLRARVARVGREVRSVAMFGACFSLAYVAAGRLDGYWERQAHAWDVAAGALLVREAGGRVTGGAGQRFDVDEPSIIASNGRIHDRMVALLNGRRPARRAR